MDLTFGQITEKPIPSGTQAEYDALKIELTEDMEALTPVYEDAIIGNYYSGIYTHVAVIEDGTDASVTIELDFITEDSIITISLENEDSIPLVGVITSIATGEVGVDIHNISTNDTVNPVIVHLNVFTPKAVAEAE